MSDLLTDGHYHSRERSAKRTLHFRTVDYDLRLDERRHAIGDRCLHIGFGLQRVGRDTGIPPDRSHLPQRPIFAMAVAGPAGTGAEGMILPA